MKKIKNSAIMALIVVCITTVLLFIHSCNKGGKPAPTPTKYCVGKITGIAPGEGTIMCENLKLGDMVCIPCCGSGCSGIWEGTRRTRFTSGVCAIVVEITESNDCQTCPKAGKVLNTDTTKLFFWKFTKKE